MTIPYWINITLSLATFVVAILEYFWVDPEKRILNLYFLLAVGAVVMATVNVFMKDPSYSLWLFLLAAAWCAATVYQLRILPERQDAGR